MPIAGHKTNSWRRSRLLPLKPQPSSPVPKPERVILNQLEVGAFVGQVQLDKRQVHLEIAFADPAKNAVKLVAQVLRRVEQLQNATAKLVFSWALAGCG